MYERILVAMDGGPASELALEQAMVIAQAARSEVLVVYVLDDRSPFLEVTGLDPVQLAEDLRIAAEAVLAAAGNRLAAAHIPHATRLLGKPLVRESIASTIAAEANRWGADLIVMGTHGRRGARRLVMGSVAREVIGQALAPVMLIRAVDE